MTESSQSIALLVLLVGALVVLNMLLSCGCRRIGVPALIGYLCLGFALRLTGTHWGFLNEESRRVLEFLAALGVIALLFRVGLESKPAELLGQLRRASGIAVGNVCLSGALAYAAARFLLSLSLTTSLIIATACVATSVGLAVGVWREAGALNTPNGELLLDVAEIDDVVGVVLMALLFALLPALRGDGETPVALVAGRTALGFVGKLVLFGGFCVLFSLYAEQHITAFFSRIAGGPVPMLVVAGIGFIIAAMAGLIGFSVAIGAFFAGLVFSRDPKSVKLDASFAALHDLFTPFFFIGIGLNIDPNSLGGVMIPAGVLLGAAVVGKLLGDGGPAVLTIGWTGGLLLGLSMIPRAEIFMIIMQRGLHLGDWAVPSHIFSAMVVVSALTCLGGPLLLQPLLQRWPPQRQEASS